MKQIHDVIKCNLQIPSTRPGLLSNAYIVNKQCYQDEHLSVDKI